MRCDRRLQPARIRWRVVRDSVITFGKGIPDRYVYIANANAGGVIVIELAWNGIATGIHDIGIEPILAFRQSVYLALNGDDRLLCV